jgi:hypothetical protein
MDMAPEIPPFIKQHKYAVGIVVIVGGVVVLYLLASGSSSSSSSGSSQPSDFATEVAAESQLAQVQAGEAVQTSAAQAQTAQAQLAANVANYQTSASLTANQDNTAATLASTLAGINAGVQTNEFDTASNTVQLANQIVGTENTTEMQDQVLESQINSGVIENANNNATALAGQENDNSTGLANAQLQETLASQSLTDEYNLQSSNDSFVQWLASAPGGVPSTTQTELGLALLNPSSASTAESGVAANSIAGVQEAGATSIANSQLIASLGTSLAKIGTGLFA